MKHSLRPLLGAAAVSASIFALAAVAQDQAPPPPPPPPAASDQAVAQPTPPSPPPPPTADQPPPAEAEAPAPAPVQAQPMASLTLPPGLSHSAVQSAILAALQHREWRVVSTGQHTVVAHLLHHHVDATITLSFNRERVDFYSTSYLVGHHADDRIASFTREDWIRNLEHDIRYYATRGTPQ